MSSLVLDLGHFSSNGVSQGRKQNKALNMAKDRERSCLRLQRMIIGRRIGVFIAFFISALSFLMLLSVTRVTNPKPAIDGISPTSTASNRQIVNMSSSPPFQRREKLSRQLTFPIQRIDIFQQVPSFSSDHPLPYGHPCEGFKLPPPPADKKRTGPRPCPVCYLPVKKAISEMHISSTMDLPIHRLSYLEESSEFEHEEGMTATSFGGHPSLEDRKDSYQIHKNMKIHCGFAQGIKPGSRSGFDIQEADWDDMKSCTGVVVASAIFGNYDRLKQPVNVSKESSKRVCFFMFVDEETHQHLDTYEIEHGIWRVVIVRNLAYEDARRNGKIPKLLLHRLFPNAKFSLWIDGKLKLVVDPYQVLERFLWRRNVNIALSRHYRRFDVFVEAEANKAARKYDNATIDAQIAFYQSEGLVPYNRKKSLFPSDVPEGCVIIREHTPVTNLFMCLWFNEVDRFTSRDQLSFAAVRDKLIGKIPLRLSMFLDCERRNFVVQEYHRDILEQRSISLMHSAVRSTDPTFLTSKRHRRSSNRQKIGSESIAAAM